MSKHDLDDVMIEVAIRLVDAAAKRSKLFAGLAVAWAWGGSLHRGLTAESEVWAAVFFVAWVVWTLVIVSWFRHGMLNEIEADITAKIKEWYELGVRDGEGRKR